MSLLTLYQECVSHSVDPLQHPGDASLSDDDKLRVTTATLEMSAGFDWDGWVLAATQEQIATMLRCLCWRLRSEYANNQALGQQLKETRS